MIPLLVALSANAAPATSHAWLLLELRQEEAAAVQAARLLDGDPEDLEAHRLYVAAMSRTPGRGELEPMYRRWHEADPDRPAARFGLAVAMLRTANDATPCEEAGALLDGLPDDPVTRYWVVRVRFDHASRCDWDVEAIERELHALTDANENARWYTAVRRLRRLDSVDASLSELRQMYDAQPSYLPAAAALWGDEARGRVVKQARADAIAAVEAAYASDDPTRVAWALQLARRVDPKLEARGRERLEALAPELATTEDERDPLLRSIHDANHRPTHELALADLDALAKKMPESGEVRARWQGLRIERLEALGRTDEVYEAARDAARAVPDDALLQNEFAYAAALRGEDLEEALAAVDRALENLQARRWDPTGGWPYQSWAHAWRSDAASWYDTRGWLLYRLGRRDEALEALEIAVRSSPYVSGVLHAHLGTVLRASGQEQAAFEHFVLAEVAGISEEALAADARAALEALWPEHGRWHPDGIDGYLEARRTPAEKRPPSQETHPLVGEPFPMDEVTLVRGGGTLSLADVEGIKVIDLWATWCGPCVSGMPHLQEVAAAYADRGVSVIGVSVDEKLSTVKRFMSGVQVDYQLAWFGREGFEVAKVSGIPALFVIDDHGKVRHHIGGYGKGDTRLEEALDGLLEEAGR